MIHIVTSRPFDLVTLAADVAADRSPTHVLLELARRVPVTFHMPGDSPFRLAFNRTPDAPPAEKMPTTPSRPALSPLDRLRAKLISRPDLWALGRHAVAHTDPGDVLFCTGEDIGIPLAAACAARGQGMRRLIVTAHNLNRPRVNAAFRLFRTLRSVSTWVTPAASQAAYLRSLGVPPSAIDITPEQSDHRFYSPGPRSTAAPNPRPLLVAVGLERRDYRTLAQATEDMPVDVRISGYSTDARALSSAFPDPLPANMTRKFYDWPALRQLYRDADIVIVPLLQNRYVAGMTSFLEGHACQKPVIVSQTEGLAAYISDTRGLPVPPENAVALKAAITTLLSDPEKARTIADQGRRWLLQHHTPDHWVTALLDILYADIREPWRSLVHQSAANV